MRLSLRKMKFVLIFISIILSVGLTCIDGQRVKAWGDISGKSAADKHIFAGPVKGTIQMRNVTYRAVSFGQKWNFIHAISGHTFYRQ